MEKVTDLGAVANVQAKGIVLCSIRIGGKKYSLVYYTCLSLYCVWLFWIRFDVYLYVLYDLWGEDAEYVL